MEYVPGRRLLDFVIDYSPVSEKKTIPLMKQLLDATIYLHSFGIIHRDIKLENMMITGDRGSDKLTLKILDFGLAAYENNIEFLKKSGTPGYVAPEILVSDTYGVKVDVFSLGVILFTMLSGRSPFVGPDRKTVLALNRRCDIVFKGRYWNNKSVNSKDLVKKMMEPDPNKRVSAKQALDHPWFTLVYLNGVQPLINIPKVMTVSNSHIFASRNISIKLPDGNNHMHSPRSRKKSASETTFLDVKIGPTHNDRRKSSTVDTGRSVSVKNFDGSKIRKQSYLYQHLLQIPIQTPTHNPNQGFITSTWGEAENASSLEDGINRNSIRTFYKVCSSSNYESSYIGSEVTPTTGHGHAHKRLEKSTTLDDEIAKENPDIKSRLNSNRGGIEASPRHSTYADWSHNNFPSLSGIPETKEDKQSCEMSMDESFNNVKVQLPKKGNALKALTPRLKNGAKKKIIINKLPIANIYK